jgi:hypothetical protein
MIVLLTTTMPMAVHDLFVVLLAGCGWFVVARMLMSRNVASGDVAVFGAALITFGGLCRVFWTLLGATTIGWEVAWLGNILFPLLCAGFIFLAWALWRGLRGAKLNEGDSLLSWGVPILLSVALLGFAALFEKRYPGRGWFMTLLVTVTATNLLAITQLIWHARKCRAHLAALFFVLHIIALLSLAGLSSQTGTLQFLKQVINTLSQGAFLAAALMLHKRNI